MRKTDILIIGSGFAGLSCLKSIKRDKRQVTLLTNRNHFLFSPLLPQATAGTVEVRSIVEPIYSFAKTKDEILIGEAEDIDPTARTVQVKLDRDYHTHIQFNSLVVAIGAETATFGIPGVKEFTLFMREMKDARKLREQVLERFERAAFLPTKERKNALVFAIVGAGATGIEVACEIHDLIHLDLIHVYPELVQESTIQIIEGMKEILPAFDRTLAEYAKNQIKEKGILLRTECRVQTVEENKLILATGETIEADTIIWAAGNGPQAFTLKLAEKIHIELERGRIPVDKSLGIKSPYSDFYAIGDCSAAKDKKGNPLPAAAQVAMRQGIFLAKALNDRNASRIFNYESMGMLASLGSGKAIADLGAFQFKGIFAWWFWKAAYLTKLVSWRNKVSVAVDWLKVKLFGRNTARIDF